MGKIAGSLLAVYLILKILDTLGWAFSILPNRGITFGSQFQGALRDLADGDGNRGPGHPSGLDPAVQSTKQLSGWLVFACLLDCAGIVFNRFIYDHRHPGHPGYALRPVCHLLAQLAGMGAHLCHPGLRGLLISLSYRYLPIFPQEKELNE